VPAWQPAYLIHGDDITRIGRRHARLRALAEAEQADLEQFEGASPEDVAAALQAMTLGLGRRFLIVDGVEAWKPADLEPVLAALRDLAPDTTVAFFGREDARTAVPDALVDAVRKAGGKVDTEQLVKPWDLPKWAVAHAQTLGIELDITAARALVARVGDRQPRLERELEKLALSLTPPARIDEALLEELAASSAERKAFALADALVERDQRAVVRIYLDLRTQGERLPGLLGIAARRVREAIVVVERLEAGESTGKIRGTLRMPAKAAERFISACTKLDVATSREMLARLADLEHDSRQLSSPDAEDTVAIRALLAVSTSR
jgi:DNA polymerase-3 subunit delta